MKAITSYNLSCYPYKDIIFRLTVVEILFKEIIHHLNYYIIPDKISHVSIRVRDRSAVMLGNVHVPGDQGFVCYWMEKSNLDQWHPLTLASASGSLEVSNIAAASKPRPGGKATELPGGRKKTSKNLMHSTEQSCRTWLWKIIPDACSAKMEL